MYIGGRLKITVPTDVALRNLVAACESMRDGSGFFKARHMDQVGKDAWSAWAMQIKEAKKALYPAVTFRDN